MSVGTGCPYLTDTRKLGFLRRAGETKLARDLYEREGCLYISTPVRIEEIRASTGANGTDYLSCLHLPEVEKCYWVDLDLFDFSQHQADIEIQRVQMAKETKEAQELKEAQEVMKVKREQYYRKVQEEQEAQERKEAQEAQKLTKAQKIK